LCFYFKFLNLSYLVCIFILIFSTIYFIHVLYLLIKNFKYLINKKKVHKKNLILYIFLIIIIILKNEILDNIFFYFFNFFNDQQFINDLYNTNLQLIKNFDNFNLIDDNEKKNYINKKMIERDIVPSDPLVD
jgi:hypothetical protein